MYFDSIDALLKMDGHGVFVWSAYGISLVVILALVIAPLRRQARLLRDLAGELRRSRGAPSQGALTTEEDSHAPGS